MFTTPPVDPQAIETIGVLGTAVATIALVFLLWKAVKQMEATVSLSKIQTNLRFRPWIGPSGKIKLIGTESEKIQFDLTIKNFGEIPATEVTVYCKKSPSSMNRTDFDSESFEKFDLGPVLPNMEKHYWIFVDKPKIESIKNGSEELYTFLYMEYPAGDKKSGYGMISQYSAEKETFVHKDMWVST